MDRVSYSSTINADAVRRAAAAVGNVLDLTGLFDREDCENIAGAAVYAVLREFRLDLFADYTGYVDNYEQTDTCRCDNCGWTGPFSDTDIQSIDNLGTRLDPGGTVPARECPECGALCYPIRKAVPAQSKLVGFQFEYRDDPTCQVVKIPSYYVLSKELALATLELLGSGHTFNLLPIYDGDVEEPEFVDGVELASDYRDYLVADIAEAIRWTTDETDWHRCKNCGHVCREEDLEEMRDFIGDCAPGKPVPSGQCPKCEHGLCYPVMVPAGYSEGGSA